ncbi:tRNA pseudouridine55 synthase [Desulfobaculum xiamenense]|uniref:tRNA pseudouridine synthase B n=1 Tax=Desulfobaculum xiamenense TaxID=995050 RepID=A0A846QLD7_9BACT|nr:tRNA pseudouridine(55) synthase TruB [Desulfobaculum xiamenense]NJB66993.1 tRNA pseudouridine55 synthase [Desulfobaculum xiamenense]
MGKKRKRSVSQLDGILVLDKPTGPSSAQCLNTIRRALDQGRIGHAGTLDPMAKGVLLVLLGHGTKLAPYLTSGRKTYSGQFRIGQTTDTYDAEGTVTDEKPFDHLSPEAVEREVLFWKELETQTVPPVSAAKHEGKPLYALARAGREVPVKTKSIEIFHAEVLEMDLPWVRFRVGCSAGTYVRSLVHSLGIRLGCGAVLTELIREDCHPFGLERAVGLDELLASPERLPELVVPLRDALPHWPAIVLDEEQAGQVRNGTWLPVADFPATEPVTEAGANAMLIGPDEVPLALVESAERDGVLLWSILRGLW